MTEHTLIRGWLVLRLFLLPGDPNNIAPFCPTPVFPPNVQTQHVLSIHFAVHELIFSFTPISPLTSSSLTSPYWLTLGEQKASVLARAVGLTRVLFLPHTK